MEKIFYPTEKDYNELDNYIVSGMILTYTHPNEPLWIPWVAPQSGTGVLTNPSLYTIITGSLIPTTTNINLDNIAPRVGSVGSRQYIDRS